MVTSAMVPASWILSSDCCSSDVPPRERMCVSDCVCIRGTYVDATIRPGMFMDVTDGVRCTVDHVVVKVCSICKCMCQVSIWRGESWADL
jgi:hypothetical protein